MSLTGDPATDKLVPIALRFVGAVREMDADTMDELLAEVITATEGRCDPAMAMATVLAAMVPDYEKPSVLLSWLPSRLEFKRLTERGVPTGIAKQLTDEREEAA